MIVSAAACMACGSKSADSLYHPGDRRTGNWTKCFIKNVGIEEMDGEKSTSSRYMAKTRTIKYN